MENGLNPSSEIFATDCTFEKDKRYLITAPSGKGKSTLLHILYGLRKDYKGKVTLEGKPAASLRPDDWSELRQRRMSIVFQDLRLFLHLTARENIMLKPAAKQSPIASDLIESMAARLGMTGFLDKKCETLSYGQRQRIAIIRALVRPFDLLLLDEPFSHLDEENTRKASQLIAETCRQYGAGFLLVSLGETYSFEYDRTMEL